MIIVDDREQRSGICEELQKLYLEFQITHLNVADYIINDKVYIERKTIPDFIESLQDGRLFNQVKRLRKYSKRAILIIEGKKLPGRPSIRSALCSLAIQWYLPILRSTDQAGTAWILKQIANQKEKQLATYHQYDFRDKKGISSLDERILLQFRSIGPDLAQKLLNHFGNAFNVLNASKEELMQVKNVGEYIADQIILLRRENEKA